MAFVYSTKVKTPHSALKQARSKPAPDPALSSTDGCEESAPHAEEALLMWRNGLLENEAGALCWGTAQHSPTYFRYHAGEKVLPPPPLLDQRGKSLLHMEGEPSLILGLWYLGPAAHSSSGTWLTAERLHAEEARKQKAGFFTARELMVRCGSTGVAAVATDHFHHQNAPWASGLFI